MNRYTVEPVSKHDKGMHRWMVVDTKRMVTVYFAKTRDQAETEAALRNTLRK